MKVHGIELTNFRNYESLQLAFDQPRTLLIGPNGAGKSTLVDAIAWVLTGRCRGVNARGEGQKDLIRLGAEEARVEIDLGDGLVVARHIARNGSAGSTMKTEQILGQLDTSEGMVHAVLYGRTFFDLQHAAAKSLLMDALNVTVPAAKLPGVDLGGIDEVDLDTLEQLYQRAFEDRAGVKRQLAAHQVPDKPKVIDMALAGKSAEELADQLKVAQGEMKTRLQDQVDADRDLQNRQHAIDQAEDAAGQADKLAGSRTAHEGMLAEHQGRLQNAQADLAAAQEQQAEPVDQLQAQVREAEVLIDKLGRHDPDRGCVLSASIPCLTKAADFSGQVETLRKQTKDLGKRVKAGQERAAAIAAAQQRVRDEERNVTYHQGQLADIDQKIAVAKDAAAQLKTLKAGLADLKRAAKKADAAVTEQQQLVDHAMASWQAVVQYQTALASHNRAVSERADLEDAVDKAEALVALLGPKGIRLQVLDEAVQEFNAAINVALQVFGFSIAIQVDPWKVLVDTGAGEAIRFEMLSKGQQLFTGLAFQLALADVSGLDFAVVDDVEAVVGKTRQLLTGTVMTSDLGQILVSMAKAADEPVPTLDGLQVVRMDQNQTVAV